MSDPIEELKNAEFNIHDVEDIPTIFRLSLESIEFLASRLTDLERMVADYKIAVDAVTDWVDKRDKEMYEKALPDLEDEPARAEIVERYVEQIKIIYTKMPIPSRDDLTEQTINALIDEVTK